jgi:hypothetical protein
MEKESESLNQQNDPIEVNLLYFSGSIEIDNLVEAKYQGEDVYVTLFFNESVINLIIDDFSLQIETNSVVELQFIYDEGFIVFLVNGSEITFSYNFILSRELLHLLIYLNVPKKLPHFIVERYKQMLDKPLFNLIDEYRESMEPNSYIHFYNEIDELEYSAIIEAFASNAINDVPLLYLKYVDSDVLEEGMLVTYNGIYTPQKFIALSHVNSVRFDVGFGFVDDVNCYINGHFFSTLRLIVWDKSISNFPYPGYSEVFPLEKVRDLINDIFSYLNKNDNQ